MLPSKLGATVGDGGGNMGRSGGDGGSEGVGSAYGREEEAGNVVADSKRPEAEVRRFWFVVRQTAVQIVRRMEV